MARLVKSVGPLPTGLMVQASLGPEVAKQILFTKDLNCSALLQRTSEAKEHRLLILYNGSDFFSRPFFQLQRFA